MQRFFLTDLLKKKKQRNKKTKNSMDFTVITLSSPYRHVTAVSHKAPNLVCVISFPSIQASYHNYREDSSFRHKGVLAVKAGGTVMQSC